MRELPLLADIRPDGVVPAMAGRGDGAVPACLAPVPPAAPRLGGTACRSEVPTAGSM